MTAGVAGWTPWLRLGRLPACAPSSMCEMSSMCGLCAIPNPTPPVDSRSVPPGPGRGTAP